VHRHLQGKFALDRGCGARVKATLGQLDSIMPEAEMTPD
jgi:hypothetical protein